VIDADSPEERLRQARSIYERCVDHYERQGWLDEVKRDYEFYHGYGQWSAEDVEYLRRQSRPALTFNLIHSKLMHLIGTHEDNLQEPVAAPVSMDDRMLAEILNHVRDRIWSEISAQDIDAQVHEEGVVVGIANAALDAMPDPDDPSRLRVGLYFAGPFEVLWDPASERRDRRDARFVVWHRWLSRGEFKAEYPEHAARIDEIWAQQGWTGPTARDRTFAEPRPQTDYQRRRDLLYYDARADMVRVVRIEYRRAQRVTMALDPVSGATREVDAKTLALLKELAPDLESQSIWREAVHWIEFVGHEVIFDAESPLPIDDFSISSFVCHQDDRGLPYGKVRQLRDPQSELNKRYSQMLHLLVQQTQPGIYAEQGAVAEKSAAEKSLKMAGTVTELNPGGLTKIRERGVPQFPDGAAQLHQQAIRLIDMISGIWSDQLTEPRGVPEAAATAQLKHRQSLLAMRPVIRGFDAYQRQVFGKLIRLIVRAMPDAQIADMLGSGERYRVQGHVVTDAETGQRAEIGDVRALRYRIEVRPADENNSERLLELSTVIQLMQLGHPVDPDVVTDLTSLPADKKQALKRYARQQAEAKAKSAQAQIEAAQAQLASQLRLDQMDREIDAAELAEKNRHNQALEQLRGVQIGKDIGAILQGRTAEEQRLVVDLIKHALASHDRAQAARARRPGMAMPAQGAPQ